ncbi:MAG TPA: M48 family metallopeptidase [Phycisphaerales bacterium]|nr:M48 family metallopeptidase [Phycisphaerales bacterium]HRQ74620.1 M48 family metallopeptidase [Phycisphaerales bacterium]
MSGVVHTENPPRRAYPANVTFNTLIRANKRKSAMLMIGMGLLLVLIGAVFGGVLGGYAGGDSLLPSLLLGAIAFAIIAAIGSAWSFYGGSSAILFMSGARPIEKKDDPQLFNVVEELAIAGGIPLPKVYLIDDPALNAFATGRDPQHAAVAITTGLRQQLSRDELAGVMAHEIAHIRHYDIRFAMLMATMVGIIVFASDAMLRMFFYGGAGRRGGMSRSSGGKQGGNPAIIILLVLAILLAILAPLFATLIRLAVSRQREYLADAGAVELTRYPQGLIGALEKLGGCKVPLKGANRATAHLFIVNPLKDALKGQGHELSSHFRTHPPLHDRINRLKALIQ